MVSLRAFLQSEPGKLVRTWVLVKRTVGRSDGRTVGRSDGRTVGRSDGRTVGRSDGRTVAAKVAVAGALLQTCDRAWRARAPIASEPVNAPPPGRILPRSRCPRRGATSRAPWARTLAPARARPGTLPAQQQAAGSSSALRPPRVIASLSRGRARLDSLRARNTIHLSAITALASRQRSSISPCVNFSCCQVRRRAICSMVDFSTTVP
jgi:hypothetical protein